MRKPARTMKVKIGLEYGTAILTITDGIVEAATHPMSWAKGKTYRTIIDWLFEKRPDASIIPIEIDGQRLSGESTMNKENQQYTAHVEYGWIIVTDTTDNYRVGWACPEDFEWYPDDFPGPPEAYAASLQSCQAVCKRIVESSREAPSKENQNEVHSNISRRH